MTLPGPLIQTEDANLSGGPNLALSTPFIVAITETGPQSAVRLRGTRDLTKNLGTRTAEAANLHDWLEGFWQEGGGPAYVSRLLGPGAVAASANVLDNAAGVVVTLTAPHKGAEGDSYAYEITVVYLDEFTISIYKNGTLVETSDIFTTGTEAAAWVTASGVTVTDGAGGSPVAVASPVSFTGGTDDLASITSADVAAAFAKFPAGLGPGHLVLTVAPDTAYQLVAAAHGDANNRILTADHIDSDVVATLTAQAVALRAGGHGDIIDLVGPRLTIPGLTTGGTRTLPASALRCGRQAANDRAGISPNQPAAGKHGEATGKFVNGVTREWDDTDRETLNDAGVNVTKIVQVNGGVVRVYGSRTLADLATDPAGIRLGSARLRMAIKEICRYEGEQVEFDEVTDTELGALEQNVKAGIKQYIGSLFSLTVNSALVDGDSPGEYVIQTDVTFQARPDAEVVRFTITRTVQGA